MARFDYDVNITQRYIDVHKQFQGGLKTVDTDDALGAVFLRQADNISISEFGFLEKRYGTFENFKKTVGIDANSKLQGYWEFKDFIIYAVDGDIFVDGVGIIETFHTESGFRYPTNNNIPFNTTSTCAFVNTGSAYLEPTEPSLTAVADPSTSPTCGSGVTKISCTCENFVVGEGCVQWSCQESVGTLTFTTVDHFQRTRDMNAVNINDVLYIFTGTYPVYAKVVNGDLKFYLFSIDIPTFDEIVVTGHNLLQDDYEGLYFPETFKDLTAPALSAQTQGLFEITETDFYPKIAFASPNGTLDLKMSYRYKNLGTFDYTPPSAIGGPEDGFNYDEYFQLKLDRVGFRNSGAGASNLDFSFFDKDAIVQSNNLHNLATGQQTPSLFSEGFLIDKKVLTNSEFESNTSSVAAINFHHQYKVEFADRFPRLAIKPNEIFAFQFFERTNDANNPWNKLLFSSLDTRGNILYNVPNDFTISITPFDENGDLFEVGGVTITSAAVQTSNLDYVFTIPSGLSTSDFVFGYEVRFVHTFIDSAVNSLFDPFNYEANDFSRSFSKSVPAENFNRFSDNQFLTLKLNNLVSGTFDIQPVYILTKYILDFDGSLILNSQQEIKTTFFNLIITPEKLQDFPGSPGVAVKPTAVWTCNRIIEHFDKLMIWGSEEMPNAVFYSFPDRPMYFPQNFYLNFGNDSEKPVESVKNFMNILVVQTSDETWGVRGNSGLLTAPAPYVPFTINPTVGTVAWKSVRPVRNHLYFLSKQGIIALKSLYAADEQYNIEYVDLNIRDIVDRSDTDAVGIQFDNQYWLNFPKTGITLRYYIDKKAWVKDTYRAWETFKGVFRYYVKDGELEFITHPSRFTGTIDTSPADGIPDNPAIYKVGVDYSLPTDLGADIVALFETAFLNQNYPFHPKNYKETKMDFTLQNEYNLGRDPIYNMETNEDINQTQTLHTIVAPSLIKNHRYQLKYEAYIINGGDFGDTPTADVDGGTFNSNPTNAIDAMETYTLDEGAINLHSTTIPFGETSENTYEFLLANNVPIGQDLTIARQFIGYEGGAILLDITYDHVLDFRTWVVSEDRTLNLDNVEGYDQSKAEIPIELGAKFGDWVFGFSDLGDKITTVKTIKLSGRGYNSKIYFEDYSRSKWTLESLGITYKMRRARSR